MAKRILVVDDDPSILSLVATTLELEGYEVQTAVNGLDALALAERRMPALIVLDMRMPVLDGWGFAQQARERGMLLPIVVMTAARDAARWAAQIDADDYVAKPFDLEHLIAVVERVAARGDAAV